MAGASSAAAAPRGATLCILAPEEERCRVGPETGANTAGQVAVLSSTASEAALGQALLECDATGATILMWRPSSPCVAVVAGSAGGVEAHVLELGVAAAGPPTAWIEPPNVSILVSGSCVPGAAASQDVPTRKRCFDDVSCASRFLASALAVPLERPAADTRRLLLLGELRLGSEHSRWSAVGGGDGLRPRSWLARRHVSCASPGGEDRLFRLSDGASRPSIAASALITLPQCVGDGVSWRHAVGFSLSRGAGQRGAARGVLDAAFCEPFVHGEDPWRPLLGVRHVAATLRHLSRAAVALCRARPRELALPEGRWDRLLVVAAPCSKRGSLLPPAARWGLWRLSSSHGVVFLGVVPLRADLMELPRPTTGAGSPPSAVQRAPAPHPAVAEKAGESALREARQLHALMNPDAPDPTPSTLRGICRDMGSTSASTTPATTGPATDSPSAAPAPAPAPAPAAPPHASESAARQDGNGESPAADGSRAVPGGKGTSSEEVGTDTTPATTGASPQGVSPATVARSEAALGAAPGGEPGQERSPPSGARRRPRREAPRRARSPEAAVPAEFSPAKDGATDAPSRGSQQGVAKASSTETPPRRKRRRKQRGSGASASPGVLVVDGTPMRECGACGTLVALEGLAWRHFDGVGKQPVCAGCLGAVDGSDAEAADSPEGGSAGAGRGAGEEGASGSEGFPALRKRQRGRQRRVEGQADGGKDLDPTSLQEDVEYLWYAEGAGRWLRVRMGPVQDGVAVLLLCDAAEATALGSDLVEDVTLAQHRFQPAGSRRSGSRRRSRRLSARHSSS